MKRLLGGVALFLCALIIWLAWPEPAATPPPPRPDPLTHARPPAVERALEGTSVSPAGASGGQALWAGSRVAERAPDGTITLHRAVPAPATAASEAPPPSGAPVAELSPDGTVTVLASPSADPRGALQSMRATATLQPDGSVRLEREPF